MQLIRLTVLIVVRLQISIRNSCFFIIHVKFDAMLSSLNHSLCYHWTNVWLLFSSSTITITRFKRNKFADFWNSMRWNCLFAEPKTSQWRRANESFLRRACVFIEGTLLLNNKDAFLLQIEFNLDCMRLHLMKWVIRCLDALKMVDKSLLFALWKIKLFTSLPSLLVQQLQ